jgi:8-oxo-dGTP pyrophosphatase MutT (NUDIX family)
VVFRRKGKAIEVALISVKSGFGKGPRVWCLPKGLVEKGENIARTAHREVKEETGLDYFFLMEYTSGDTAFHDEEVEDCRWFLLDEAIKIASYEDEREILKKAGEIIKEQK